MARWDPSCKVCGVDLMALLERNPHDQAVCRCGDRVGVHAMVHPHFSSENEECIGWMEQGDESFED